MINIAASEIRKNFSDSLNKVAYQKERIILNRSGKDIAVIVPIEDLELLEKFEDLIDNKYCDEAIKESEIFSYQDIRKELSL